MSVDDVVKEFIAGMERAFVQVQLSSEVRWQYNQFAVRISAQCALQIEASNANEISIRTWGNDCKGIEVLAGAPRLLTLDEIKWNLSKNSFSASSPNWATNGLLTVISPLLNGIFAPRLPKSVQDLRNSFSLQNPQAILSALVPLLTGKSDPAKINDIADKIRDAHMRYEARLPKALKIRLRNADLFLAKNRVLEVAITLSGPHRAPQLETVVMATPVGTVASPTSKSNSGSIAQIVDTLSVGIVSLISIDRAGNYSVMAGSLFTQPEEWRYKHSKGAGEFVDTGRAKPSGTVNNLIGKEAPKMLGAFRAFLKQTQPSIPLFLPRDLFRDL